ncbi:MAG TPA: SDR family NAD(P)-dependent oxidoreductase [Candidatus Binatia bacterium]|jgi:NAD(P)-dependent dehydrogenase (short-subunit alcohol dehydrogenase family)|nr:SDR family NAD(P)-dependent oxidoreductase [Candidatus Binatia bacterium]
MQDLRGKVAVVTGAASGIGRALATRFAGEGMRVVLADVEQTPLDAACAELAAQGHDVRAVRTDVSRADDVQRLAEATLDAFGKVHVVCNNAGVFTGGRSWQAPLSDYEWVLGVNVWGVLHGLRAFVPILLAQGEPAHIVNTASMAGVTSAPMAAAYYMSKHAVVALSESLFHELSLEKTPVGVSVLCPEMVSTGIARSDRNRPAALERGELEDDPGRDMVEGAIRELIYLGVPPSEIADRVLSAVLENRFWILSKEGGTWRASCDARLEDIRLGRNPTLSVTGAN